MNDQSHAEGNHHVIVGRKYLVKSATRRFATRIRERTDERSNENGGEWSLSISFKLGRSQMLTLQKDINFSIM